MHISSSAKAATASSQRKTAKAKSEEAPEVKDWTVLMYIAGDNDLEPYAAKMMQQIEDKCGTTKNINVVAQLGRMDQASLKKLYDGQGREYEPTNIDGDWGGMRRYVVTQQDRGKDEDTKILSKCVGKPTDKKMSNATALADFLVYGMKNYPSKHTMVVLADHGGGWLGAFTSDASASGHSIMKPDEIASAFKIAETATGKKPEVVDMVACLMATSEVAYQMKDRAKYLLASEEIGTTASFDYGPIIAGIDEASQSGKAVTPKTLVQNIVHHYDDQPEAFKTKSAVDLPKMELVKDTFTVLVDTLKKSKIEPERIAAAIEASQNFGITTEAIYPFYDQIRDLRGLAANLTDGELVSDKKVRAAAKAVVAAVDVAVVDNLAHEYTRYEVKGDGMTMDGKEKFTDYREFKGKYDAHGLSVFAPLSDKLVKSSKMAEYQGLDFTKETGWGDFITELNAKLIEGKKSQDGVVARPHNPEQTAA
ncbi:hypothetical protein IV102_15455 [bacterium]|nr:hypothetical protein [bacterium]